MSAERYPFNFTTMAPDIAVRFGDQWECAIDGCDFSVPHSEDDEVIGAAVMFHAATRHPRACADATGKNPEELAARYKRAVSPPNLSANKDLGGEAAPHIGTHDDGSVQAEQRQS